MRVLCCCCCCCAGCDDNTQARLNQDRISPELYHFKNREGKIIVVYDEEDGKVAGAVANTMVQKGFENVHLLSGGMKRFAWPVFW